MVSVKDFTLNFSQLSDAQYKKFFGIIPRTPATESSPSEIDVPEVYSRLLDETLGHDYGAAVDFITIGTLFSLWEDTPVQVPINPGKVLDVLVGDYGLMKGFHLVKPLVLGETPEGNLKLNGGRHRLCAIISMLKAGDYTDEEILDVQLPAITLKDDLLMVIADNTARGATGNEKLRYRASSLGIDVNNPEDIVTKYVDGKFPATPSTNVSTLFKLLILLGTEDYDGITDETKIAVMSGVLSEFKSQYPDAYKQFVVGKVLNLSLMNNFLNAVIEALPQAVADIKASGVTLIARQAKPIALNVMKAVNQDIKSGALVIPPLPTKEVKAKKEKPEPSKEVKEKKAKKQSTKKTKAPDVSNGNGATVIPEATVPPSSDVKVIVSQ